MFSQACVSSRGGLCMMSLPVWLSGHMHLLGGLCLWSHVPFRESLSMGSLSIGSLSMGSLSSWFSVQGGMHPTGMLPCVATVLS